MHQYIGANNSVITEELFGDRIVNFLYSTAREQAPVVLRLLTSARISSLLGFFNFDFPLSGKLSGSRRFLACNGVRLDECLDPPEYFDSARKIFERRIRYWHCRPMPMGEGKVLAPADSRLLCGTLNADSLLSLKGKFFDLQELLGEKERDLHETFHEGECAIFRLTPEKYHYNHVPVSGRVMACYEIDGAYHSCNPGAVVEMVTPYSKNKRVVTIIDTDVPGGTQVGLVAMIEIVALMIGEVVQCYCPYDSYNWPKKVISGMFLRKGQPKSLFRPGSSTVVLLFQQGRIEFDKTLTQQMKRSDVSSRFTIGFGGPLAEVDVMVRSFIAEKI